MLYNTSSIEHRTTLKPAPSPHPVAPSPDKWAQIVKRQYEKIYKQNNNININYTYGDIQIHKNK